MQSNWITHELKVLIYFHISVQNKYAYSSVPGRAELAEYLITFPKTLIFVIRNWHKNTEILFYLTHKERTRQYYT